MPRKRSTKTDSRASEPKPAIPEAKPEVESGTGRKRSVHSSSASSLRSKKILASTGMAADAAESIPAPPEAPAPAQAIQAPQVEVRTAGTVTQSVDIPSSSSPELSVQEKIALLAYSYWEARGRPGGSPDEDWFRAERQILGDLRVTN